MTGRHTATMDRPPTLSAVEQLRADFDAAFGAAPLEAVEEYEDRLAIRVGSAPYAIRLADITGLHHNKHITALPGASPDLLGIAGFRGAIVAVYDLRVLLGHQRQIGSGGFGALPWMVLAERDSITGAIGFAFDGFEGHLRVLMEPADRDSNSGSGSRPEPRHLRESTSNPEYAELPETARPLVDVPALVTALTSRH